MHLIINKNNNRAFTLIELLVVVAVMAILAGIAVPYMKPYMAQRRLNGAVQQVYGDLMAARQRAITESRTIGVVFSNNNHVYTIFADTNNDGIADSGETVLQTRDIHPDYYDVWVDGQSRLVAFYPNGTGRNPAINFGFSGQTTRSKHIDVSTAGRIKVTNN